MHVSGAGGQRDEMLKDVVCIICQHYLSFIFPVLFYLHNLLDDFIVSVFSDIRELIQVDDVMEDDSLRFGPNGGLVFCMEYFVNNFDWLEESLGHVEDDYILFDCPGKSSGGSLTNHCTIDLSFILSHTNTLMGTERQCKMHACLSRAVWGSASSNSKLQYVEDPLYH